MLFTKTMVTHKYFCYQNTIACNKIITKKKVLSKKVKYHLLVARKYETNF